MLQTELRMALHSLTYFFILVCVIQFINGTTQYLGKNSTFRKIRKNMTYELLIKLHYYVSNLEFCARRSQIQFSHECRRTFYSTILLNVFISKHKFKLFYHCFKSYLVFFTPTTSRPFTILVVVRLTTNNSRW